MRGFFWAVLALCTCFTALAEEKNKPSNTDVVLGMLVSGEVTVGTDGSVVDYSLVKPQRIPSAVRQLIGETVPAWKFEPPLEGDTPIPSTNRMNLRVIARENATGDYEVRIVGAHFAPAEQNSETIRFANHRRPPYPKSAQGVSGTVYLVLKVDRDGQVQDVLAEQVNLRNIADENRMKRWRLAFAESATRTAWKWRFDVSESAESHDQPFISLRVPVDFSFASKSEWDDSMYGKWVPYIPGPRTKAPWLNLGDEARANSSDSSPDAVGGEITPAGRTRSPRLISPQWD